ncbi:MAG: toll/interleukin-1 receptor domain-containing protein, partial [Rhizomicrobium sp.]
MTSSDSGRIQFFLSHSMKDHVVVEMIREHIESLGVDLYLAEHDPQPGTPLAEKVIKQINACDAMVVLLTEAGAAAPFVQQEIGVARGAGKLIVPIVQKGIDPNMLAMLVGVERIDVDFPQPPLALAAVTDNLKPLVQAHVGRAAVRDAYSPGSAYAIPI